MESEKCKSIYKSEYKSALYHVPYELLPKLLELLPENHRLAFLRFEVEGRVSIAEKLISNPPLPKTEHSFAGDYLTIYSMINSYRSAEDSHFFSNPSVAKLARKLEHHQSFDAIKKTIQDFVKSEQNELTEKLIQTFKWCRKPNNHNKKKTSELSFFHNSLNKSERLESSIKDKVKKILDLSCVFLDMGCHLGMIIKLPLDVSEDKIQAYKETLQNLDIEITVIPEHFIFESYKDAAEFNIKNETLESLDEKRGGLSSNEKHDVKKSI